MPEEKPSLSERIKALTAKSAPSGAEGAAAKPAGDAKPGEDAPAKPAEGAKSSLSQRLKAMAKAAGEPAPAAEAAKPTSPAKPAEPGAKTSLSQRLAAMAKGAGEPAKAAAPAAPAAAPKTAAPPAPAKPAEAAAPKAPAPPAKPAPAARSSLSERLKSLAAGKSAEAPGPVSKAPAAKAPADVSPAAEAPAKPAAKAAPGSGTALAGDRIAQRLRGEKPAPAAKPAAPPPPPAPPELPAAPRTYTPYVDDGVFEALPAKVQRVILQASNEEGVIPVRRVLRTLRGPDLAAHEELVGGFAENVLSVLRRRFIEDEADIERSIFREPQGDLSLRSGDGDVTVRGKCWEFFFLWRWRRPLGKNPRATALRMVDECFTFSIADTDVCKMKVEEPVRFDPGDDAYYMEGSLERGGWCELRFEGAQVFTDGRVLVVCFDPRVVRPRDVPPPKGMSPKDFVSLLNQRRGRS